MRQFYFFLFIMCLNLSNMLAQSYTDYNRSGDRAMEEKNYNIAKSYYSTGLDDCDYYSIKKLTEIWDSVPELQRSLRIPIIRCRECLFKISADTTKNREEKVSAMSLLSDYYRKGVGVKKDLVTALKWETEAAKMFTTASITNNQNFKTDNDTLKPIIIPKIETSEILPHPNFFDKYDVFLGYTFSPTMPVGIVAGVSGKYGIMLGIKSNDIKRSKSEYNCNNEIVLNIDSDNYSYNFTKEKKWHSTMFTVQVLLPAITKNLFISAGCGYGKRELYHKAQLFDMKTGKENGSVWCHNVQESYKGMAAEAGILYKYKYFVITGGMNSISLKDFDGYVGIGCSF